MNEPKCTCPDDEIPWHWHPDCPMKMEDAAKQDEPMPAPENETIQEKLDRLESGSGGWTKKALAELGVPWPPVKGWRKRLLNES